MSKSNRTVSLSTASSYESSASRWRACFGLAPAFLLLLAAPSALAQPSTTPSAIQPQAATTPSTTAEPGRTSAPPAASGTQTSAPAPATGAATPTASTEANVGAATTSAAMTGAATNSAATSATQPSITSAVGPSPAQAAQPASAAVPPTPNECKTEWSRSGFYLRGLFTTGYVGMSGTGPSGKPSIDGFGGGSVIAIGGSIAEGLVLAGTLQASQTAGKFKGGPYQGATFTSGEDQFDVSQDATAAFSQIGALIDWYPTQSGFHVGLSGGFNSMGVKLNAGGDMLVGTGTSGTLILGYDWPVSRTIAMGISLVGSATSRIELKYDGEHNSGYELSGRSIGIAGSFLYF